MKFLDKYNIQFNILIRGENHFEYRIDKEFFDYFKITDINNVGINVDLNINKNNNVFIFRFLISGFINVSCDRCLDRFDMEINSDNKLYVKFAEEHQGEQTDNLLLIPKTTNEINIAHYIYEFIYLSLPIKKVHPDNKQGISTCNKKMIEIIENLKNNDNNNNVSVWNELNKLKNGTS